LVGFEDPPMIKINVFMRNILNDFEQQMILKSFKFKEQKCLFLNFKLVNTINLYICILLNEKFWYFAWII
jgi:hypothetical protein